MRQRIVFFVALCMLSVPLLSGETETASTSRSDLVVHIEGLKSSKGSVALALFADSDSFDSRSRPVRAEFVALKRKRCKWIVEDLPAGTYALVAYHDKNGNRELDRRKMFGIPSEPYGFSNDARGTFGPPRFEAARFQVDGRAREITVRLR